jgi:hypothetical protein
LVICDRTHTAEKRSEMAASAFPELGPFLCAAEEQGGMVLGEGLPGTVEAKKRGRQLRRPYSILLRGPQTRRRNPIVDVGCRIKLADFSHKIVAFQAWPHFCCQSFELCLFRSEAGSE